MKKRFLSVFLTAALSLSLLSGCGSGTGGGAPASQAPAPGTQLPAVQTTGTGEDGGTIKIGVLVPLTGAFAALGVDGMEGTKMAFEQIDYKIGGKTVELFFEDTAADPDLCIQKVSRLVEREGVDIILGPLSGGEAVALKDYAPNIPDTTIIVAGAASEDVTMRGCRTTSSAPPTPAPRPCSPSATTPTTCWATRRSSPWPRTTTSPSPRWAGS